MLAMGGRELIWRYSKIPIAQMSRTKAAVMSSGLIIQPNTLTPDQFRRPDEKIP